jgi:hypothetical protein
MTESGLLEPQARELSRAHFDKENLCAIGDLGVLLASVRTMRFLYDGEVGITVCLQISRHKVMRLQGVCPVRPCSYRAVVCHTVNQATIALRL